MNITQLALQSVPKQDLDPVCNQWQAATNDRQSTEPDLKEYIEAEQQWLQEQAYQHDRYLYADRI